MTGISIRVALWLSVLLAAGAFGTLGYNWAHSRGAASRQGEINALSVRLTLLSAANEQANTEAARKAQEAAARAKAIEDEANTRIAAARAAADAAEAARAAGAVDYDRRLRSALAARAGRCDEGRRDGLPEAAGPERAAGAEADGILFDRIASDLGALARGADRINDAYRICLAAARAGREVSK